ncbi:hypothetical protein SG34_020230 [Thalassomonas viridans]|uniref:Uncharacterized protein n=1 Tax=Thalassomonas viridans TaxID=137584 RepID=A0AAF0C7T6_9GAMM|nr:hypothetical protein [Thalassomonas viridans]WDE03691.1 hypothetical protein SG34_020230 [Thalassomonas viridans]
MEITVEHWFALTLMIFFVLWGIAIFCFGRITVKYIENEMAKEGKLPPVWDSGIGARLVAYSSIILFPNIKRHASLVDIEATKRYARKKDWYLALFLEVTFYAWLITGTIAYFLFDIGVS